MKASTAAPGQQLMGTRAEGLADGLGPQDGDGKGRPGAEAGLDPPSPVQAGSALLPGACAHSHPSFLGLQIILELIKLANAITI